MASLWFDPAHSVEDRLFRWLLVLRLVLLADAVAVDLHGLDDVARPGLVVGCVMVMMAWTAYAGWACTERRRRGPVLLVADLTLALALVAVTPILKGPEFFATVPGFWVVGATMAWAVQHRWLGGLVAGAVVAVADLAVRSGLDRANSGNLFLLLVSGPIVGFMVESLVRMADQRDVAQRAAAAAAERTRLSRAVHDGVGGVGGTATLRTGADGTEWELVVPRAPGGAGVSGESGRPRVFRRSGVPGGPPTEVPGIMA